MVITAAALTLAWCELWGWRAGAGQWQMDCRILSERAAALCLAAYFKLSSKAHHLRSKCCFLTAAFLEFLPPLPKCFYRTILFICAHTFGLNHPAPPPSSLYLPSLPNSLDLI